MFMFSKKAIRNEEIFTVDLMLCSKCQIEGEHFVASLENINFKDNNLKKDPHLNSCNQSKIIFASKVDN